MNLSRQETERFYGIWLPLLHYVNVQRQLVARVPLVPGADAISPTDAGQLRQELWKDDALREGFIAENPARLSDADLEMVASWRYRVAGQFYILRYLKKYAIFLTREDPPQAYGVLGLVSPIQEIIPMPPPVLVDAVLLPFEDRIIYDSLLMPYRLMFGAGIRRKWSRSIRVTSRGSWMHTGRRRKSPARCWNSTRMACGSICARRVRTLI